ncbi:unnamed protein product, partial [Symbiodinium necroappetens]
EGRSSTSSKAEALKEGFMQSLQLCAATASHLEEKVIREIPEAAKQMWQRARGEAEEKLRNTPKKAGDFDSLVRSLTKTVGHLVWLFRHYVWEEGDRSKVKVDKIAADKVTDLILDGLDYLMPICPHHVFSGSCEGKRAGTCNLDHPVIEKTGSPDMLLARSEKRKLCPLQGIGVSCWLDIVNVCSASIKTVCKRKECKWLHPNTEQIEAIRTKFRYLGSFYYKDLDWRSENHLAKAVQGLLEMISDRGEHRKLPKGFGCCFFEDGNRMLNVRLVTIVARAFLSKGCCDLGLEASTDVLKRMCRALYRYPDPEACKIRSISNDITWEVEGCLSKENSRCLLSAMLGREKATQHQQESKTRKHPAGSTLNPHAKEFVPGFVPGHAKFLKRDAPPANIWVGNAARELFGSQTSVGGAHEQLATEAARVASRPTPGGPIGSGGAPGWAPTVRTAGSGTS